VAVAVAEEEIGEEADHEGINSALELILMPYFDTAFFISYQILPAECNRDNNRKLTILNFFLNCLS